MKNGKISSIIQRIIMIISFVFLISNIHMSEKVKIDKLEADKLLKEVYKPLEDFNEDLIATEDVKLLSAPSYITCEEDFLNLFNKKMKDDIPKGFYEDLIIEEDGKFYVDASAYIPNIYTENGQVTVAYIKKTKRLFHNVFGRRYEDVEKLKITETWRISGETHRRSNYFIKNENGEWILDYFNGTSHYGYADVNNNPWRLKRLKNTI